MAFESTAFMTVFDLALAGVCFYALFVRMRYRKAIVPRLTGAGFHLISAGMLTAALFCVADLLAMHVLPRYLPGETAELLSRTLRSDYLWYAFAASMMAMSIGLVRNIFLVSSIISSDRVNRERFRDVVEVAGDWIWEMDADLRFSYLSDRFYQISGFAPADIIGKTRGELIGEFADPEAWERHLDDLENRRAFRDFEYAITLRDGSERHWCISGKPLFDEKGVFRGYRGTGTDRTAEIATRQALEESEKQFRDLIDGSIQGVLIHNDWDILFANPALAEILGYTDPLEILDHGSVENLIAPNEHERLWGYNEARKNGRPAPVAYECECLRKDGTRIWAEFRNTRTTWRGQPATQCVVVDITERKKAEAALQEQNEALRQRDAELREQNERFNVALENMSQGLVMFDAEERVIVSNDRYATMYGLSPEQVKPGTDLEAIRQARIDIGIYPEEGPEAYRKRRLDTKGSDAAVQKIDYLSNGQVFEIKRQSMSDGSWIATHEDISERKRAEAALQEQNEALRRRDAELREQNERFNLALENMSHGLAMFDADRRLIVCNRHFATLYGLEPDSIKPGMGVREILELRIANGMSAGPDPESYIRTTLERVAAGKRSRRQLTLKDGRIIEALFEPMAAGGWLTTHEDITERVRAESALKQQNERFNAALANMTQGLAMFDPEQRLIVCNRRYAELYDLPPETMKPGITLNEIIEQRIAQGIYASGDPEEYIRERQAWVTSGKRANKVQELSNGRVIAITHQPMADGGWLTTHEDITDRVKTLSTNLRLARIVENAINEVYVFDAETLEFLQANASACRNLGYSMEELSALRPADLQANFTPEQFEELLAPLQRGEKTYIRYEAVHRRKDGSCYDAEVVLQQIRSEDRPVFAAIAADVTERNEALQAIRKSEELFFKAFHASPALSVISRPEDGAHYDVNEAWVETLGYSREEAMTHSALELGIWADSGDRARFARELESRGSVRGFEARYRTRDGAEIDCIISGEVLRVGGEPRFFVTAEDVTQRKRAEEELIAHRDQLQKLVDQATLDLQQKAAELERALAKEKELNALQRQFVTTASHEFRTPLAIIDSSVQRLLRTSDLSREALESRVRKIRDAVRLMSTLMDSTLSAALIDAGKIRLNVAACGLAGVLTEVCERQKELKEECDITTDIDALPETVQGDAAALNQIFTNLLSNAVKYSPEGGKIIVRGGRDGEDAVVAVSDHGVGIDAEDLPRLFTRFFRARTSTGIAGTGIGLNVVKTLVEMHGGSISVESVKGEGSTFTVRLPVAGPSDKQEGQSRAA